MRGIPDGARLETARRRPTPTMDRSAASAPPWARSTLMLQRMAGNRATGQLLDARVAGRDHGGRGMPAVPVVQRSGADDVTVTFGSVRSPSTPTGMVDRIAPGRTVPLTVTLADWHPPMLPITLRVVGGPTAGTATVDGGASTEITGSGTVTIAGGTQTGIGAGAGLRVTATLGPRTVGTSAAFAVCAIPIDWTNSSVEPVWGDYRGVVVQDGWSSDGTGSIAELDATEISEHVRYHGGTGCFAGNTSALNSGYQAGNVFTQDRHTYRVDALTSTGNLLADQVSTFNEQRTGATDIAMTNSGMRITRDVRVRAGTEDELDIETSKVGATATANGHTSAAGTAVDEISEIQYV